LNDKQKAQTKLETMKADAQRSVDAAVAEGRIIANADEKRLAQRNYANLYAALHLTPEQAEAVTELIIKKGHGPSAKKADGSYATSEEMLAEIAATDEDMKKLLGDTGYAAYLDYYKTTAQRDLVMDAGRGFMSALPIANQLTADQSEQLVRAVAGVDEKFEIANDLSKDLYATPGAKARYDADGLARYLQEYQQLHEKYLVAAQPVLSPEQLAGFKKFLAQQLDEKKQILELRLKHANP
jgi:hypothetical protein